MGTIFRPLNLRKTVQELNIKNIVETGTGLGTSIKYICDNLSDLDINIYSIELMQELYLHNVDQFKSYSNVNLFQGYSDKQLTLLMNVISSEPTLFWLDAHYPGADFGIGGANYTSEADPNIRLPLQRELESIKFSNRDITKDIFVIDDLRIYKDGLFTNGNCDRNSIGAEGNQFVYDLFNDTHNIVETYLDEGYVIMWPK